MQGIHPMISPSRTASMEAKVYPIKNRYMLAPISNRSFPENALSANASYTSAGPGNRLLGNTPVAARTCHKRSSTAKGTTNVLIFFMLYLRLFIPAFLQIRHRKGYPGSSQKPLPFHTVPHTHPCSRISSETRSTLRTGG